MTPRDGTDSLPVPSVYWLAHGSALVRVSPERLRHEAPRERQSRLEQFPQTDVQATVRRALQPVRGPVRFLDLLGDPPFADASGEQNDMQEPEESTEQKPPEEDEVARGSLEEHREREENGPETATADTPAAT